MLGKGRSTFRYDVSMIERSSVAQRRVVRTVENVVAFRNGRYSLRVRKRINYVLLQFVMIGNISSMNCRQCFLLTFFPINDDHLS
jgi:hypothetical protein